MLNKKLSKSSVIKKKKLFLLSSKLFTSKLKNRIKKLENKEKLKNHSLIKMAQQSPTSFSKQMRIATRDVHKISDALVNAKMVFGTFTEFNINFII